MSSGTAALVHRKSPLALMLCDAPTEPHHPAVALGSILPAQGIDVCTAEATRSVAPDAFGAASSVIQWSRFETALSVVDLPLPAEKR